MNKILYIIALLFFIVSCGNFKENVGLVKYQPDEYQVETNTSLAIPPNFNIYSPSELMARNSHKDQISDANLSRAENLILQDMNQQ